MQIIGLDFWNLEEWVLFRRCFYSELYCNFEFEVILKLLLIIKRKVFLKML